MVEYINYLGVFMEKKTMFIVGGVVLAVVLVVGGIFTFKQWDNSQPNTNPKYTKCIEDAEALEQKNEVIIAKVDEKWNSLTLDVCKKEIEPQHQTIR